MSEIRTTLRRPPLEVLALIGMIYMRGLLGQALQGTNAMFYEIFGNPVFGATMSRNRFEFLIVYISFDDHTSRPTPWQHDRFAAFREIFEEFTENCGKFLVPDDHLSLDETLYLTTVLLKLCVATPRCVVSIFQRRRGIFWFVPLSLGFIASKEL